jgi:hypothetical protein
MLSINNVRNLFINRLQLPLPAFRDRYALHELQPCPGEIVVGNCNQDRLLRPVLKHSILELSKPDLSYVARLRKM